MIDELIDTIARRYDLRRHRALLESIWQQERWFDTPHQRRAAEIARDALAEAGVADAHVAPYPADGRTRFQDWTTRMAWECPAAQLRLDDEVLADRATTPCATVAWSGPLAETTAGVVDVDAIEQVTPDLIDGKFVLTAKIAQQAKLRLLGARPVAVVSDFLGSNRGYDEHTTRWCNAWADEPGGWYVRRQDRVLPGFCITPATGRRLRAALAADPNLRLTGFCNSRLYDGECSNLTAVVPGRDPGAEIWLLGHTAEEGAHDNCSGVSAYVTAACLLHQLIDDGTLPRPRCGIRIIGGEECLGTLAFVTGHEPLRRRALAGFSADGVGDSSESDRPFYAHYGPFSAPSFGWGLAGAIGRRLVDRYAGRYYLDYQYDPGTADHMIADPNCGIPAQWLGMHGSSTGYHSSADTPAICPDESRAANAQLIAAWAYTMANLDDAAATALLPDVTAWIDTHLLIDGDDDPARLRRWVAGGMLRHAIRLGASASVVEPAAARYAGPDAAPLPGLSDDGPRYRRTTWGTCTFETLPADRKQGLGRWQGWLAAALFWTDGQRTVPAIERLARAEAGRIPEGGLEPVFETLVEAGLARRWNT